MLTRVDLMVYELNDKSINGGLNEINALGEGHLSGSIEQETHEKCTKYEQYFLVRRGGFLLKMFSKSENFPLKRGGGFY